jgi:anti-sigma-K factor RskA
MTLRDEHLEELAALHAFDLLEGDERAAFERQLVGDSDLQRQVNELREAGMRLGLTAAAPPPPAHLRARVLASAGSPPARVVAFPTATWWGWSIAAVLALSTLVFSSLFLQTKSVLALEREQTDLLRLTQQQLAQNLEAEQLLSAAQIAALQNAEARVAQLALEADVAQLKITSLASLLGDSPEAQAIAVWHPAQQRGVLTVDKMPALAEDRDYQLWVIDPAYETPVDGGVFRVDPATGRARVDFTPDRPVAEVTTFAVSLERKGGVPVAEGPMVLLSL